MRNAKKYTNKILGIRDNHNYSYTLWTAKFCPDNNNMIYIPGITLNEIHDYYYRRQWNMHQGIVMTIVLL